ncbi:MAG: hypothetical protein R3B93_19830 [Bacteroidia bacterium]
MIPYFISSHPGCKEADMANLAAETKDMGFMLEQVQGFTPTPMTMATVIYYTSSSLHPSAPFYTMETKEREKNQHLFFSGIAETNSRLRIS